MFFTIKERCLFRKQRKTIKTSHIKTQSWSSCATHCSYYLLYICLLKCISAVCNCVFSRFRNIQFYYYFVQSSASLHSPQVWCFHSKQDWLRFEWKTNPDSSFVIQRVSSLITFMFGSVCGSILWECRSDTGQHGSTWECLLQYGPLHAPHANIERCQPILTHDVLYWPMLSHIDPICPYWSTLAHIGSC